MNIYLQLAAVLALPLLIGVLWWQRARKTRQAREALERSTREENDRQRNRRANELLQGRVSKMVYPSRQPPKRYAAAPAREEPKRDSDDGMMGMVAAGAIGYALGSSGRSESPAPEFKGGGGEFGGGGASGSFDTDRGSSANDTSCSSSDESSGSSGDSGGSCDSGGGSSSE